jgi:DNA-binding response OmpR family regulator
MITAEATKANVLAAAQAGVTDFIVKPFSMDQLMLKIERLRRRETSIN